MTETYAVTYEEGPFGEPTDTIVIHGAGDGNGPDDELSDDGSKWNIAIVIKAVEDRSEYLAGLARIGFEPAGVDEAGRELVRRVGQP